MSAKSQLLLTTAILTASFAVTGIQPSFAQDQDNEMAIEEIVVEARRVQESLQDTPVAVSAFNETAIDRMFATDLSEVANFAPNVSVNAIPGFRAAVIAIRGVSTGDIPSSFDPAVSVVVDGFVFGHAQTSLLDFFDIEQIEILRGPQGTLFGKNTIGGVVNVRTKRPGDEFGVEGVLTAGNHGRIDGKVAIDIPMVEGVLGARFVLLSRNSSGDMTNLIDGSSLNGDDILAMRGKLHFTPNDNFEALLTVEYEKDRSDTPPVINTSIGADGVYGGDAFFLFGGYPGRGVPGGLPLGDPHETSLVGPETHLGPNGPGTMGFDGHHFDIFGVYLNASYAISDSTELTWISGYRSVEANLYNDYVGEAVPIYSTVRGTDRETFSQELRLSSDFSDSLSFVGGVYYQQNDLVYYNWTSLGSGHPFVPGLFLDADGTQDTKAWAAFGEANYRLNERLRLFAGMRYTDEKKDFFLRPLGFPSGIGDSNSWDDITYRVGMDYQVSDDVMGYISFSTGFKSGGFNEQAGTYTAIGPFDEEKAKSFEVGLKSDLMDNRLRLNLAAFHVKYDDLQLDSVVTIEAAPGQESRVTNAGKSTVWGLELEATALLAEGFLLNASIGYLDAKYDSYACVLGNPAARPAGFDLVDPVLNLYDCTFLQPKRTPKWTLGASADYEWSVGDMGMAGINVSVSSSSKYFNDTLNSLSGTSDKRTLMNASVRLVDADDRWKISAFVLNLTDKNYRTSGLGIANLWGMSIYGPPRTWGIEVGGKF